MARGTLAGQLAAMGFADTARARVVLTEELGLDPEGADGPLVTALAAAADPDLALTALARMEPGKALRAALRSDASLRYRLVSVLGASAALGDHLARHPSDWQVLAGPAALVRPSATELRAELLAAVGAQPGPDGAGRYETRRYDTGGGSAGRGSADPRSAGPGSGRLGSIEPVADRDRIGGRDPATELRLAYRRRLLHLAARDLTGADPLESVMAELADLATAVLEAALAVARTGLPPDAAPCRLAVIAMGKCGGRELNYASDVDVIFVAAPAEPDGSAGAGGTGEASTAGGPASANGPASVSGPSANGPASVSGPSATGPASAKGPASASGPGGAIAEAAALRTATALASGMIRVCSQLTPAGIIFPVDPNLRPEGRSGPLVRTLSSHRAYYERWAKTWEFQALLKARPAAGDAELGAAYIAALGPMVWQAVQRPDFVADVQSMRRRVLGSLPRAEAGRELKLGPGGLRDIEFAVQLLQLVHGRVDESLRAPGTLAALAALAAGGYVGRDDAAGLASAYQFLRSVEHLLQLRQLRRTHTLPQDRTVLRHVGRALRWMRPGLNGGQHVGGQQPGRQQFTGQQFTGQQFDGQQFGRQQFDGQQSDGQRRAAPRGDPAVELVEQWRRHAAQVRQLHEKLFYRPLLSAVAQLPGEAVRLTPAAAEHRLEALGYVDPAGALRHIEALRTGMSRKAAIQRTLLPVLLGWFADAPQPDAGLLAFRQVSEALGNSPWYLRLLRDNTVVAQRMARLLASSPYATGLLLRAPEAVGMLADDAELAPRPGDALMSEALAAVGRHKSAANAVGAVLAIRRRELLRTAMACVLDMADVLERGDALSAVAAVTVAASLRAASREVEQASGPLPTRIAVIAMGRFGGGEMGFASDADVIFVHDPLPGAAEETASRTAHQVAENLRALLARPGPDPGLYIDAGLRPEGRQGPLVRTLASYRAYYRRWSVPWEAQALLRASFVAGDPELGAEFIALADEIRYPDGGIPDDSVREIRRIKARMEAERMPRGMDRSLNLKLGPGGLTDVEWVTQLFQLRYAHAVPGLRTTGTLTALAAAAGAGLVSEPDAGALKMAWLLAAWIRDGVMLMRGRGSDALPSAQPELAVVARLLGYRPDRSQQLTEDWRRTARQARNVTERLFYG
jgi:glutamate-ammonia-ligase adenylyltransferase